MLSHEIGVPALRTEASFSWKDFVAIIQACHLLYDGHVLMITKGLSVWIPDLQISILSIFSSNVK